MAEARTMEEALLGAVLRDGGTFAQAREIVGAEDFLNWNYQNVWAACERLHEQGLGIDVLTVGDEIERLGVELQQGMWSGRAVLSFLRDDGDPDNVLSYAERVQDYAVKRRLDEFLTKAVVWSKNGRRSKDIMQDVSTEFSKIQLHGAEDEFTVPIATAAAEAFDLTDRASRGEAVGIPTGFMDLDKLIGGLINQNVYLVAARPSQGKTAILLEMALHAGKMGKKVAVFSLEMSRAQVAQRLISMEAEIDLLRGVIGGRMNPEEWERYHAALGAIEHLPITVNDLSNININQIRQTARKLDPDIIFLDYIQLADSGEKKTERRELDVSAVSRGLKYLARELDVPVVAAAQLSREIEKRADKHPILADLRESGSLEQDAYAVMFLYVHEDQPSAVDVIVAKHRNGPKGIVSLYFKAACAKFEDGVVRTFRPNEKDE